MSEAAYKYDKATSIGLKSFDEKEISAFALQDLMFRVFMVKLTPAESVAVIDHFDRDHSGSLDYAEFLISFFHLASTMKQKSVLENEYTSNLAREKLVEREKLDIEKFASTSVVQPGDEYTSENLQTALDKVAITSSLLDRAKAQISSFDSGQMDHTGFKQQLLRNFDIRVSNPELGALFEYFDRDSSGLIDMTEFLISFFQLAPRGIAARKKKEDEMRVLNNTSLNDNNKQNWAKVQQEKFENEMKEKERAELAKKNSKAAMRAMKKIRNMSEGTEGFNLRKAFAHFDKDNSGSINHAELVEVCKDICGDEITPGEIVCVIKLFDPNGDGDIQYDEFAYSFYNRRGVVKDETDLNEERVKANITQRAALRFAQKTLGSTVGYTMNNNYRGKEIVMTKEMIRTATFAMDQVRQKVKISLRDAFDQFDEDESGEISHGELTRAITKISGRKLDYNESAAIIAMFDPNGDGSIAYDEFCWTFYNRRMAIKKMIDTMKKQQAKSRVMAKRKKMRDLKRLKDEEFQKEYLPEVGYERGDIASTRTAKAAITLLGSIGKNKGRLKHSSLRQSRGCTMIRCRTPQTDAKTGKAVGALEKEFKTRVLRFDMKWVALLELKTLLYRRSCKISHFLELMKQRTFNNGWISRKDFCLTMVEGLGDLDGKSHNRLYSCFDHMKKDMIWIGEFAVGLDCLSTPVDTDQNEIFFLKNIFKTLVKVGQINEDGSDDEGSDDEEDGRQRKILLGKTEKKKKKGTTPGTVDVVAEKSKKAAREASDRVTFVNLVTSFMTLSLDDKHDYEIAKQFRGAFEKQGGDYGRVAPLRTKRDQAITFGGIYASVTCEEFDKILSGSEKLLCCLKQHHEMVLAKVSDSKNVQYKVVQAGGEAGEAGAGEGEREREKGKSKSKEKTRKKGTIFQPSKANMSGLNAAVAKSKSLR